MTSSIWLKCLWQSAGQPLLYVSFILCLQCTCRVLCMLITGKGCNFARELFIVDRQNLPIAGDFNVNYSWEYEFALHTVLWSGITVVLLCCVVLMLLMHKQTNHTIHEHTNHSLYTTIIQKSNCVRWRRKSESHTKWSGQECTQSSSLM